MGYKSKSIRETIDEMRDGDLVLPAMQRNYVWKESQIIDLFDSLMKQYPIGAFLYWRVEGPDLHDYAFNKFIGAVDLIDELPRGEYVMPKGSKLTAVLDGQQRLTSIMIGLAGSYRSKVKATRKVDGVIPRRQLYLNVLHNVVDAKNDKYDFRFLSEPEAEQVDAEHYWVKVSDVFERNIDRAHSFSYVAGLGISRDIEVVQTAVNVLNALCDVIFDDDGVSFYTAINKDLAEAVEIFERINNNGQSLSGTDLMLSMASAVNKQDMQKRIDEAMKQIENATLTETGFKADRSFILTACLMATEQQNVSTTYRDNYKQCVIQEVDRAWDQIIEAICNAAVYIQRLGFDGRKLGKSFMQPIVYYFYKIGPNVDPNRHFDSTNPNCRQDRASITQWLLRAQINQIFAYGVPGTLKSIRDTMRNALDAMPSKAFPLQALMAAGAGTSLNVSKANIDDILTWKYGDQKVFPLLTVILEHDCQANYDVDHMWPQAKMASEAKIKKAAGSFCLTQAQIDFYKGHYNLLPNLQLLRKSPNAEKNDSYYNVWLDEKYPEQGERDSYRKANCVPDISYDFSNFEDFYVKRRDLLKKRMMDYFGVQDADE